MSAAVGKGRGFVIAAGGVAAVLGLYWDDAWHTDVGRDTFFAPPHLLLYAGVSALLAVFATWAWQRLRVDGRRAVRDPAVVLPLLGTVVTLGAAPVDELWHQLFGRDAVTWSPPHMVAVGGMVAFAAGLLLLAARSGTRAAVRAVIGGFLIAAAVTVVMEFETDVPQFPVVLYLPVMTASLTFAFGLIHRASERGWAATQAAAVYMVLRLGVIGFLAALGHSLPTVMPTVVVAWAFEVALRRGARRWGVAVATAGATSASHTVAHVLQPAGLSLTGTEVAVGVLAGAVGAWVVLSALGLGARAAAVVPAGRAVATGLAALAVLLPAGPAFAHDPGQGDEIAPVRLEATRRGDRLRLDVGAGACQGWEPVRVVARRAGRSRSGPLEEAEGCRFAGTVTVDDPGRWFVYAELHVDGRLVEAWLPGEPGTQHKDTVLYVPAGDGVHAVQIVAGSVLYLLVLAILAAVVLTFRSDGRSGGRVRPAEGVAVGAG
jgi:hypothetical protein